MGVGGLGDDVIVESEQDQVRDRLPGRFDPPRDIDRRGVTLGSVSLFSGGFEGQSERLGHA